MSKDTGADPQKLTPQLVVRDLRNEQLVMSSRSRQPVTSVLVLSRMTDLAEDASVEQQPHVSSPARRALSRSRTRWTS